MSLELLLKGLLIGFSIAMPVGPIGLLCIRNTLSYGILFGLLTGLGAAFADTIYGAIAGFGVAAITGFLEAYSLYIQLIGAVFLCYLGITTFFAKPATSTAIEEKKSPLSTFLTSFFLTLTNPLTIMSFAGVYAGLGIGNGNINGALITTTGVFIGSAIWWILLTFITSLFREKMSLKASSLLNKLSGSVIFGFGALSLVT